MLGNGVRQGRIRLPCRPTAGKKRKRKSRTERFGILVCCSDCAGNLTGTQTPGTNIYMARRTVDNSLDTFHIGLPGTIGAAMRVGHLDAKDHALVAKLALSHPLHLLAVIISMCPNRHNWYINRNKS